MTLQNKYRFSLLFSTNRSRLHSNRRFVLEPTLFSGQTPKRSKMESVFKTILFRCPRYVRMGTVLDRSTIGRDLQQSGPWRRHVRVGVRRDTHMGELGSGRAAQSSWRCTSKRQRMVRIQWSRSGWKTWRSQRNLHYVVCVWEVHQLVILWYEKKL